MTSAATIGKAADEGSAGTDDRARRQRRPPGQRDAPAFALDADHDLGAEMGEHLLGMVARGLALDDRRRPTRVEAGEQDRRFDLRRGDRRAIEDRRGIGRPFQHDRTAVAFALREHLRAHQLKGIEDAAHRPLAQRRVAVEGRGDSMAADHPHHQPRTGAGVAEIERFDRRGERAEPRPANIPSARRRCV